MNIRSFGIIGGDSRQLYCAKSIAEDGFTVRVCGFDNCDTKGVPINDISSVIKLSDALILPLPMTRNGKELFAPFSSKPIELAPLPEMIGSTKPVFIGLSGQTDNSFFSTLRHYFYGSREGFATANAVPTAEGAVACAINNSDITLCGSECLVIGFGRIGKVLSSYLHGMGAYVTVSARKEKDLEMIKAFGMKGEKICNIKKRFSFIFNTVPSLMLDRERLALLAPEALVIDLASPPGGVDDEAAEVMNIPVIHALSLPGKVAPKSAGIIIKNAVYNIIGEESL